MAGQLYFQASKYGAKEVVNFLKAHGARIVFMLDRPILVIVEM